MDVHLTFWVDIEDSLGHHVHFEFSDSFPRSNELTVQICEADHIIIDDIECTDTGSCQRFNREAAHTADSEDCDTAPRELLHRRPAKQQLCSRKLIQHNFLYPFI